MLETYCPESSPSLFAFPREILFGCGAVKQLSARLAMMKCKHPLIVTGPNVAQRLLAKVISPDIYFSKTPSFAVERLNPTDKDVEKGSDIFAEQNCDSIIAIGGGSRIDVAKGIRVHAAYRYRDVLKQRGCLDNYYLDAGGESRIKNNLCPLITIPTVAGSGSEVSRGCIITDTTQNRKRLIASPYLMPSLAILDPELTLSCPAKQIAESGIDCLCHAIEAYVGTNYNPMAKGMARQAAAICYRYLPRTYHDDMAEAYGATPTRDCLEARGQMMIASATAALCFGKGLGVIHSLAHALSPVCGLSHGLAIALMMPIGMTFNLTHARRDYSELAYDIGCEPKCADDSGADELIAAVERTRRRLNLPTSLSEVGVKHEQIPELAEKAMLDLGHKTNPRACTLDDMKAMYERAW